MAIRNLRRRAGLRSFQDLNTGILELVNDLSSDLKNKSRKILNNKFSWLHKKLLEIFLIFQRIYLIFIIFIYKTIRQLQHFF